MKEGCRNIYKTARQTAGMTQERWAELIGVSADSVRLYESGRGLPSDEVVARMAEIAQAQVGYCERSAAGCGAGIAASSGRAAARCNPRLQGIDR